MANTSNMQIKNSIKTPAFWSGIITAVVISIASQFDIEIEDASTAGVVTALLSFFMTRHIHKRRHLKKQMINIFGVFGVIKNVVEILSKSKQTDDSSDKPTKLSLLDRLRKLKSIQSDEKVHK